MATNFEADIEAQVLDVALTRANRGGLDLNDEARAYLTIQVRSFAIAHANNTSKLEALRDPELGDRYLSSGIQYAQASIESVVAYSADAAKRRGIQAINIDGIRDALRSLCPWWPFC